MKILQEVYLLKRQDYEIKLESGDIDGLKQTVIESKDYLN